jgi:hypothetical protein
MLRGGNVCLLTQHSNVSSSSCGLTSKKLETCEVTGGEKQAANGICGEGKPTRWLQGMTLDTGQSLPDVSVHH